MFYIIQIITSLLTLFSLDSYVVKAGKACKMPLMKDSGCCLLITEL